MHRLGSNRRGLRLFFGAESGFDDATSPWRLYGCEGQRILRVVASKGEGTSGDGLGSRFSREGIG